MDTAGFGLKSVEFDRNKLRASLKLHEGFRRFPYQDAAGKMTIGYGHNLSDRGLYLPAAERLLDDDIDDAIAGLDRHFPWWRTLDDVRQRVLAELSFNVGISKLRKFVHTMAAIQRRDWERAADQLMDSLWSHQVGTRATTLEHMLRTGQDAA